MATRKAIKAINWASIAERLGETDKAIYAAFRTKSDGFLRRMEEYPEQVPPIDWAFYKKNIAGSMVDSFQKEYENLKIPYPSDKYTAVVEQKAEENDQKVQAFITESNARIAQYTAELTRIENLIPFNQMTMEDLSEAYPDSAWNPEKPTLWPHTPEYQCGDEPPKIPKPEH